MNTNRKNDKFKVIKNKKKYISVNLNLMKAIINIEKNGYHIFKSLFDKKFISTLSDIIKKYHTTEISNGTVFS